MTGTKSRRSSKKSTPAPETAKPEQWVDSVVAVAAEATAASAAHTEQDAKLDQVIETLRGRCLELSFTVHNLPKSRRIGGKTADQIAQSVGGKKRGVRASWSLFSSNHPAVAALNIAIRDLNKLRDSWTIVRSAEVKKGGDEAITIEGGKRLIWDQDIEEFYVLFVRAAMAIDTAAKQVQYAMNHTTTSYDAKNNEITVPSIKTMDKGNAGDAWDEKVYPHDISNVVGVAKERYADGEPVLGPDGNPKYIITFNEYHVSEKLPQLLQERAIELVDKRLAADVETATGHIVAEMVESVNTFKDELTTKILLRPQPHTDFAYLTEHSDCQVVKTLTRDHDPTIPVEHVKVYVRYTELRDAETQQSIVGELIAGQTSERVKIGKWLGPMKRTDYEAKLRPETTGERKKLFPGVIEGIIEQMQAFRDKKARMLGGYGDEVVAAFEPLLKQLTQYKQVHMSNEDGAKRLANALKNSAEKRHEVATSIADAIEAMEAKVEEVKVAVRRRTIRKV